MLDSAGYYRPDMLGTVLRIYTDSKQPSFVHWAFGKKQKIDKYIALCQQYRNDEKNVPGGKITFTSILDEAQKHYDAEALNKTWKPMKGLKDTPTEPDVPGANAATKTQAKNQKEEWIAAMATAVSRAMKQNSGTTNNGNTGGSGGGNQNSGNSGGNENSQRQRRRERQKNQGNNDNGGSSNSNSDNPHRGEYCNWCGNKNCDGKTGFKQMSTQR